MQQSTKGELYIRGRAVRISSTHDAVCHKICFSSSELEENIFANANALQNISISSISHSQHLGIVTDSLLKKKVEKYLEIINLNISPTDDIVRNLSRGTQQKIVLLRQIFSDNEIFVMDNPLKYLDNPSKVDFYSLMSHLAHKGASILFSSTDKEELAGICHRILVLENGRLTDILSPEQILDI